MNAAWAYDSRLGPMFIGLSSLPRGGRLMTRLGLVLSSGPENRRPLNRGMVVEAFDGPLKALMLKGLGGDAAAHAELLSRMATLLRRYFARKLGPSDQDVEDLVQETLLAIHLKRETWDASQPFTAWAYAIARYRLIDIYRRRRVRRSEPLESAEALFAEETGDSSARADVDRLLSELPERQRAVLKAVKLDELSTAEAAARTGMSESAVKVSVHRSLKALMRRVRDED